MSVALVVAAMGACLGAEYHFHTTLTYISRCSCHRRDSPFATNYTMH